MFLTVDNIPLKIGNPEEEDRITNETLPTAIKSLKKYADYLLDLLHSLDKNKVDVDKSTIPPANDNIDLSPYSYEDLNIALEDAIEKKYLCKDRKTITRLCELETFVRLLYIDHNLYLSAEQVHSLFINQN
jgi:hypothetical protein